MRARKDFIMRDVLDEHMLIPTSGNINEFNGAIAFNDVAAFIWQQLQNSCSREDLVTAVLGEFKVDRDTAQKDIDALLETFRTEGLLEEE